MRKIHLHKFWLSIPLLAIILLYGCSVGRKLKQIDKQQFTAKVSLMDSPSLDGTSKAEIIGSGTNILTQSSVDDNNSIFMEAQIDSLTGETIATDKLNEIVVEATFRNVAERNGLVQISFDILVPVQLQHPQWQVRFTPEFYYKGDTLLLDKIFITGNKFREAQLRGYSIYNRFAGTIVPDSLYMQKFIYKNQLEKFVERHNDMLDQAKEHYRKHLMIKLNELRGEDRAQIFAKFVKDTIIVDKVRLDSVVTVSDGNVIKYSYTQNLLAQKDLRKVEMVLNGEIYKDGDRLCVLEATKPLTFYISSMVSFVDDSPMYVTKVISRNLYLSENYKIGFTKGGWHLDESFSSNGQELRRMKRKINNVLSDTTYVVDSLLVAATCSPEGALKFNNRLSGRRAIEIKEVIERYLEFYRDSIKNEFWNINVAQEEIEIEAPKMEIGVVNKSEDWNGLWDLVQKSNLIKDKKKVFECYVTDDLDLREANLRKLEDYAIIRDSLYPLLRKVNLNFAIHRKGMIKDTVHTVVVDTLYEAGVKALKDRDYKLAITFLKEYKTINTAIAYLSMDYNNSALSILEDLPQTAQRDYMLAIVYSRLEKEQKAVDYYLKSVSVEPSFRHRGNLDPEISLLINKHKLFTNF